jgi:hypothetical protein|tara:strand:- start:19449 stop:20018 length:570 start_codon:yes stop_codon:yes gene_type:complete
MKPDNVKRYLESFGKQVVNRSKGNLQKIKGGGTNLEKSIRYELVEESEDVFAVKFYMADYGTFLDKGVSGSNQKQTYKDYLGQIVVSPYRFGTNSSLIGKGAGGMSGIMSKWVAKKGFQWRDSRGRFMSYKSMGYIIARSIYSKGIKSLAFFQKPLGLGMKQFGGDLLKNVTEDIKEALNKEFKTTVTS